jgi:hypothetical protein
MVQQRAAMYGKQQIKHPYVTTPSYALHPTSSKQCMQQLADSTITPASQQQWSRQGNKTSWGIIICATKQHFGRKQRS